MMPLDKLPGMVQLNNDECASDMIESFETLIFEYICFESDAAHKLLGAEQDWRNLDGRNHTDCDTLLYDESQAFEVCLGWNSNAVADDYRRFRNLIQISPTIVQVAYGAYLSNPLVKETESTMMLKSWEEYVDIFQTVWSMA
jgi:hypothetical protein